MAKVSVNVALNRLIGAFRYNIKGKSSTRECLCIPVDCLAVDRKGDIWLNIAAYDDTKYEDQTHSLKQKVSKAVYDTLPKDDNGRLINRTPYIGSIRKEADEQGSEGSTNNTYASTAPVAQDEDDLPF